jgi:hypothetical protein
MHLRERPETLSEAITAAGYTGFRELVNRCRVARFKRLVEEGAAERFTIEAVAAFTRTIGVTAVLKASPSTPPVPGENSITEPIHVNWDQRGAGRVHR